MARLENPDNPLCKDCGKRMRRNGYIKTKKELKIRYRCHYCGYNFSASMRGVF